MSGGTYVVMPRRGGYSVEYRAGRARTVIARSVSEEDAIVLMHKYRERLEQQEARLAKILGSRFALRQSAARLNVVSAAAAEGTSDRAAQARVHAAFVSGSDTPQSPSIPRHRR